MFPWNFFPFNEDTKKLLQNLKPGEIEKYVQDMMNKMLHQQMQDIPNSQEFMNNMHPFQSSSSESSSNENSLKPLIFETHDYVFVMFQVKEEWRRNMRLYHTSNQLIIEHIPEIKNKQVITLPAIVKRKGTTAQVKEGQLEIKLLKKIESNYSEIDVSDEF